MFLRLVADSFGRRPRHKLLTGAALALGMAVVTAALSVSLDVGDRLAKEFRSLGANLLVTPQADSLPLEIGGVDYRPANAGAYLPEEDLTKLKTIFWHNNIIAFAPILEVPVSTAILPKTISSAFAPSLSTILIGTWSQHSIWTPDLQTRFVTGIEKTNPWWSVEGRWFSEDEAECVIGANFARKTGRQIGDAILVEDGDKGQILEVVGILSSGGPEDDAIVAPIAIAQKISDKPGAYRRLYVSALTKPEDAFGRRDPRTTFARVRGRGRRLRNRNYSGTPSWRKNLWRGP
jgi:putative ABC transport system permease protein